jgi:hypothetical protein
MHYSPASTGIDPFNALNIDGHGDSQFLIHQCKLSSAFLLLLTKHGDDDIECSRHPQLSLSINIFTYAG